MILSRDFTGHMDAPFPLRRSSPSVNGQYGLARCLIRIKATAVRHPR